MKTVLVNAENLKSGDVLIGVRYRNTRVKTVYAAKTKTAKTEKTAKVAVIVPKRGLVDVITFNAKEKVKVQRPNYNKSKSK